MMISHSQSFHYHILKQKQALSKMSFHFQVFSYALYQSARQFLQYLKLLCTQH